MNPYLPIRKVPLDYDGISSSAYAVQMQHPVYHNKELTSQTGENLIEWKETGVVGHSYMLLPNEETFYKGAYITNFEWLIIEKEHLFNITGKKVIIKTNSKGYKAIFRERIK